MVSDPIDRGFLCLFFVATIIVGCCIAFDYGKRSVLQAEAPESPAAPKEHATNKYGQCLEVVDNNKMTEWFAKHLDYRVETMTMTGNQSTIVVFHR